MEMQFKGPQSNLELGQMLKKMRISEKLTQAKLAKKTGMTQTQIARIENGVNTPTSKSIKRIADALGYRSYVRLA